MGNYKELYDRSINDPEQFWACAEEIRASLTKLGQTKHRLGDDEFYEAEERMISMCEAVLGDENNKDARLVREFTELFESYKKVYKQLRQMTWLVDPGRTTDRV